LVNTLGMTMIKLPAGKFTLGEKVPPREPVQSTVGPFWVGAQEVTVGQFQPFVEDAMYFKDHPEERLAGFKGHDRQVSKTADCPMQQVSWEDAVKFCNWLSRKEALMPCYEKRPAAHEKASGGGLTGDQWQLNPDAYGYRLPTQAEWEYACRAGTVTDFCFGNDEALLEHYAVYRPDLDLRPASSKPAGSKFPNAWGLFDMHGNVYEWCEDWDDRRAPQEEPQRVLRGGCFNIAATYCRSAYLISQVPAYRSDGFGFRVVASRGLGERRPSE
jgi:formylglycine-generating enzyme required for sulfatase activity